ncbi:GOLPH3/VPS74 family protein [Pseudonocardia sp. TRM90224]|uniref:GOLPH3/VPS74 family protein n=1 Tax=Pseudonocardia sp. TRM90224 TaxID=2812678 RepID=UPI001E391ECC|nr:GPP34 family phosphoprotein [Pseudonocardia sp. TRM90224]
MASVAEDLALLLFDPTTGRSIVDGTSLDRAIGGALLLDLSLSGRVTAAGEGAKARLTVADPSSTGNNILDAALAKLGGSPVRAQRAVERLASKTRVPVLERLVERGVLDRRSERRLGLFPATAWPAIDPAPREALRSRLGDVLLKGGRPDEHTACLVSLLHAVKAEHKIVDGPRREVRARAREITSGEWAGAAVRKAVQAVQTSVAIAVSAAVSASAASSS